MYKLNVITIVGIVAAVSLVVGMASPIAFAAQHESMTMNTDNMSSMGNMTGGNATSMTGGNATSMTGGNATSMTGGELTMSEMSNATSLTGQ